MIIDAHCHVGKGITCELSTNELLAEMDANDVAKAIIVPTDRFLAVYNREGNDYLLSEAKRYPDRLYAMATANPWYGGKAIEELRRAFGEGAIGLKLHPPLQGFRITDSIVYPLIELAAKLEKPVYFHTGTPISSMPFQLTELAMRFPQVTFIMGHMAFSDFWYDVAKSAQAAENIVLETSLYWPSFISDTAGAVGASRIMFGSDMPKKPMSLGIETIHRCSLSEEDRKRIFSQTAQAVFGCLE